ncbi:MAG: hypothetical protein ACKVJK_17410, partial [Methylophagaceae bacterium]
SSRAVFSDEVRGTLFRDYNSSGYYVDPASTSNIYNLQLTGAKHTYLYLSPGNGYEAMVRFNGGSGSTWYVGSRTSSQLVGSTDAWHVYSQTAGRTVSGTDTAGNTYSYGSSRAPMFYDLDNTNYYTDPASTSVLNELQVNGLTVDGYKLADTASRSVSAGQWVTIATGSGRQYATFNVWDTNGGRHGSMSFTAGISYGGTGTITLLGKSWYSSGGIFNNIRIRKSGTYDTHYLQIYIDTAGTLYYAITNNFQSSGWSLTTSGDGNPASSTAAEIAPDSYPGMATNQGIGASVFYDSDNPSFYIDPNSSNVAANLSGGIQMTGNYGVGLTGLYTSTRIQTIFNMGTSYKLPNDGNSTGNAYGLYWSHQNAGSKGGANNLTDHGILVIDAGGFRAALSNSLVVTSEVRGSLFRDYNNTGYYVDPNSGTNLYGRVQESGGHGDSQIGLRLLAGNNGAGTGEVNLQMWASEPGNTWDWGGFGYNVNNSLNSGTNVYYFGRQNTSLGQAYMRFSSDGHTYFYNTNRSGTRVTNMEMYSSNYIYVNNYLVAGNSLRAPIFYDYTNTGYYLDPGSFSNLGTGIRATDIYARSWLRNDASGTGLYNQATGQHWYSDDDDYWNIGGGGSANGIRFRDQHAGTIRGYVYSTSSNEIGFLDQGGSWAIRHSNDTGTYFYTDNSALEFRVGRDAVTGNYGTVQTSTTRAGWGGY